MHKYNAKKTKCGSGHIHDSAKEAVRCNELHLLARSGDIEHLEIQKKFLLIPSAKYKTMPNERACYYIADFVYTSDGVTVVEDTKGFKTPEYIIKRKLFKLKYCKDEEIIFREV